MDCQLSAGLLLRILTHRAIIFFTPCIHCAQVSGVVMNYTPPVQTSQMQKKPSLFLRVCKSVSSTPALMEQCLMVWQRWSYHVLMSQHGIKLLKRKCLVIVVCNNSRTCKTITHVHALRCVPVGTCYFLNIVCMFSANIIKSVFPTRFK